MGGRGGGGEGAKEGRGEYMCIISQGVRVGWVGQMRVLGVGKRGRNQYSKHRNRCFRRTFS